jgi:hypothetical protein
MAFGNGMAVGFHGRGIMRSCARTRTAWRVAVAAALTWSGSACSPPGNPGMVSRPQAVTGSASPATSTASPPPPGSAPGGPDPDEAITPRTVSLHAKYEGACAVGADGSVRCWGTRFAIHPWDDAVQRRPFLAALGRPVRHLSLGDSLACAVVDAGGVVCWADDDDTARSMAVGPTEGPSVVAGLPSAVDVAVGFSHACATGTDGGVHCWGWQRAGELGFDATHRCHEFFTCAREPRRVEGLESVNKLALGRGFSCALLKTGTVSCWGSNDLGQLGIGNSDKKPHLRPRGIASLADVVDIAAGSDHVCALTRESSVYCWGRNDLHQLGVQTRDQCRYAGTVVACSPHPVRVPGLTSVRSLALSNHSSCALASDGSVMCWGAETDPLGTATDATCRADASTIDSHCATSPREVTGVPPLAALANGYSHLCGLTAGGETLCWGLVNASELGFEPDRCEPANASVSKPCIRATPSGEAATPGRVELASAAQASGNEQVKGICASVSRTTMPPQDRPGAAELAALHDCASRDLYFGIGGPADPVSARKCAYREMEALEPPRNPVVSGTALLSMVYANGKGVQRNIDVALKLLCSLGRPDRIERVAAMKVGPPPREDFSICDDPGSTVEIGFCAGVKEAIKNEARKAKIAALTGSWKSDEKVAFSRLERAAKAFFDARERNEMDLSGTSRASIQLAERGSLEDAFLAALERFERGKLPDLSSHATAQNAERRAFVATQKPLDCGSLTPAGIRRGEEAWTRYVEAWALFASRKYPNVAPDAFRGWLADERRTVLEALARCDLPKW